MGGGVATQPMGRKRCAHMRGPRLSAASRRCACVLPLAEARSRLDAFATAVSRFRVFLEYVGGLLHKPPLLYLGPSSRVWEGVQIDRQQFEETVRTLNNLYAEAEKLGGQSYLEGCLACLTAYTIFLCMETHYEKVLKKIAKFIQEQNEKIYAPQGLLLTDPIERGLRVIEITIYEDRGMTSGR
ncbi:PREDICTED: golgin subfamily A member 7 [Haliaeetus leucocephalus]|uniref:golgin subfamily A member 7 n=1 Tax=Haliaeetus leucocephalus TaxID=52644 RepID=UPI00053CB336|nr:PREDICTED: golgin subfamily A member 7 [Haliaeetus leucocephalus]